MAAAGEDIPDLKTRVRPEPHLVFHWNAFSELSTDRQVGFGFGPVPIGGILRYAEWYGIADTDEFDRFKRLIRAMDRAFLEWHAPGRKE